MYIFTSIQEWEGTNIHWKGVGFIKSYVYVT